MRTIGSLTLCRSLLEAGLVDRFRVVVFPVITGNTGRERIYDAYPDVGLEMIDQPDVRRPTAAARVRADRPQRSAERRPAHLISRCQGGRHLGVVANQSVRRMNVRTRRSAVFAT